jgi:multidrug resistance efflux pump
MKQEKGPPPKTKVVLESPARQDVHFALSRPGYIEAFEQTPIFAKLAAYVDKINVDIDSEVKEGDVLVELSIPELVVELEQKQALVAQARAHLGSSQAKVVAARAGVERAKADVKRWLVEQIRQRPLVKQGTLDRQSLDAVEAQWEAAKAAQAEAEAQVARADADVDVARKDIKVAEANEKYVFTLLQYAKVKSPYAGVVIKRNANKGDFVQPAAGSGSRGEPLFVLARTDKGVRIFVDVPEGAAAWVNEKVKATIRVQALPGVEEEGEVTRSSWALDAKARTLLAEVDVAKPGKLRPGMYAYVTLKVVHKNVWTLPLSAVVMEDNEVYCFTERDGKAIKTPLQTGLNDGKRIEIIKIQRTPAQNGDKARWVDPTGNERIARSDKEKLKDGQKVEVSSRK